MRTRSTGMNNTLLDPGLSAMLAGTNLSIDPGTLLQQQPLLKQPLFETDAASSCTTSISSATRLSAPETPETEDDDVPEEDKEDDAPKKSTTRSQAKMTGKSRTAAASSKSKRGGATTGNAEKRRRRNLERNRAAASKCRQRKKQWQDGLERKKIALESSYKALNSETKDLMEEVAQLKHLVMGHADCGDANIDNWIRNEAGNFVRRMSGKLNTPVLSASPALAVAKSMAKMRSPTQGQLTATPALTDTSNHMFAPIASETPFNTAANNGLLPSAKDLINPNVDTLIPDLMLESLMQTR